MRSLEAIAVVAILAAGSEVWASDTSPAKPMKMDEPMHGEMKRKNMKKGDVKKAAEKKEREMKPIIDKESAAAKKK
jgi:hypothetical protein